MLDNISGELIKLKNEFAKTYSGSSHIQELIPTNFSSIDKSILEQLHLFAKKNPIYYNWYEQNIGECPCIVYEGDINRYWLNSILNPSSNAPFSPTWIISAYVLTALAQSFGGTEIIDVGSGDGRIAFCSRLLDLPAYGIEIDSSLIELQSTIIKLTSVDFTPCCHDATNFDYAKLELKKPVFFIGGLAQMGGEKLADSILSKIQSCVEDAIMVFAGTYSKKYSHDKYGLAGWGNLIKKYDLDVIETIQLPTVWTFREDEVTPYLFVRH